MRGPALPRGTGLAVASSSVTPIPAKPVTEQAALLRWVVVMSIVPVRA